MKTMQMPSKISGIRPCAQDRLRGIAKEETCKGKRFKEIMAGGLVGQEAVYASLLHKVVRDRA